MSEEKGGITVKELNLMLPQVSQIITQKSLEDIGIVFTGGRNSGFERGSECEIKLSDRDMYDAYKKFRLYIKLFGGCNTLFIKQVSKTHYTIHQLIPCAICDTFFKPNFNESYGKLLFCSKECLLNIRGCGDDLCHNLGCRPCVDIDCELVLPHCRGCAEYLCNVSGLCIYANAARKNCFCKSDGKVSTECISILCTKRSWDYKHCCECGGLITLES